MACNFNSSVANFTSKASLQNHPFYEASYRNVSLNACYRNTHLPLTLARYCDFFMLTALAAALDPKYSGSYYYNRLPIPSTSGRKLWCLYISYCLAEPGYLNIPGTPYFLWSEHAPLVRQSSPRRIAGARDRMLCNPWNEVCKLDTRWLLTLAPPLWGTCYAVSQSPQRD